MKRLVIIHGWDGNPEAEWYPWLRREAEARGFAVTAPQLPDPAAPDPDTWVPMLAEAVGTPDAETYFVAHSMGCQTVLRYLASIDQRVGGVILVAGFVLPLKNLDTPEEEAVAAKWTGRPLDLTSLRWKARGYTVINSTNDTWVHVENADVLGAGLGGRVVIPGAMGHFTIRDGYPEFPLVLEELLTLTGGA